MRKVIVLSIFLSLCFLPYLIFADDSVPGTVALQASDSAQSMPTADYDASIPQEKVDGIKTIEEIKSGISGQAGHAEEVAQPEKKGVTYHINRFFNKNKDSKNISKKGSAKTREAEKNKTKSNVAQAASKPKSSAKARSKVGSSKSAPGTVSSEGSSAGSRIGESKSIQEQMQGGSRVSGQHHF